MSIEQLRADEYDIRRARPADRAAIVSLYRSVLDESLSPAWYDWKFRDNPATAETSVVVAARRGSIVGAGGFLPMRLQAGTQTVLAVQPCDAAVHPDHRRQGLYTDILGAGLAMYRDAGALFAFDFPNSLSRAVFETYGWQAVTTRDESVRIQRPSQVVPPRLQPVVTPIERVLRSVRAGMSGWRRAAAADPTVTSYPGVPANRLAALATDTPPAGIHAARSAEFYDWRFANPNSTYRTFAVERDGELETAVVVGRRQRQGTSVATLVEVAPIEPAQRRGLDAIMRAIVSAYADVALIVAPPVGFPRRIRYTQGFVSTNTFPLSLVSTPTVHGVCPLTDDHTASLDGHVLTDPASWSLTFVEHDTP